MWEIYDRLIAGIDPQLKIERAGFGCWRAYVQASSRLGLATLLVADPQQTQATGELSAWGGQPLCELAKLSKSWDQKEATLGVAAINAYYNDPGRLEKTGARLYAPGGSEGDVFALLREQAAGKRVATVGHFKGVGELYAPICDFSIFEREPRPGDLPDVAEEYLLPEMELVFITAMALTNKTLPRLLQLSQQAQTVITGPSLPLSELFFTHGADILSGLAVCDSAAALRAIYSEDWRQVFAVSNKVIWRK